MTAENSKHPTLSIGELDGAVRAFRDGEISLGRWHEIVRLWLDGEPYSLPDQPTEEDRLDPDAFAGGFAENH